MNLLFRLLNRVGKNFNGTQQAPVEPKKILLCNTAHLGDVVISTTVLPRIKKRFPGCKIGFLTSSASKVVLEGHPLVAKIHQWDHWVFSRGRCLCKAALHQWKSRRRLIKEIEAERYEVAVDLYSYFPNSVRLLAQAKIPVRIGYTTGGFSRLLTHPVEWDFHGRYVGYAHHYLLREIGIELNHEAPLPTNLGKREKGDRVIVHMGSGSSLKEWNRAKWSQLIRCLIERGKKVALTGQGEREAAQCKDVAMATGSEDLSNRLKWGQFVEVIQEAALLISVDSAAIHIAAASETPTVALFTGISSPYMWSPPTSCFRGVMSRVPCAPCFKKNGCLGMNCIQGIQVEEVLKYAWELMGI
jgi:ADP-heptose:LPS heptosyltransferase